MSVDKTVPSQAQWKPFTLRLTYLASLIFITIVAIVAIEVVVQTSGPGNSLAFQNSNGTFSSGATFSNRYLPTMLSVVYTFAWTWVRYHVLDLSCGEADSLQSLPMTRNV